MWRHLYWSANADPPRSCVGNSNTALDSWRAVSERNHRETEPSPWPLDQNPLCALTISLAPLTCPGIDSCLLAALPEFSRSSHFIFMYSLSFKNLVSEARLLIGPQNACTILFKCLHNLIPSDGFHPQNISARRRKHIEADGEEISVEFAFCLCELCAHNSRRWNDEKRNPFFFFFFCICFLFQVSN